MGTAIWFRWLGVAGIELRLDDHILAIDPFFTRPPFRRMWFGRVRPNRQLIAEKIQRCDFVLVTHAHWDHVMDVPDVVLNTGATALGSPNTCHLLALCGVPDGQIREIRVGDELTLGTSRVEVLPAEHGSVLGQPFASGPLPDDLRPPLRLRDYRMDSCFSFLIHVGGHRLLTDPGEDSKGGVPADVLFVNTYRHYAYYEALLHRVRPQVVIPIHWDDLFRPLSQPLQPMFNPPTWSIPPLRRANLTEFRQTIERTASGAQVLIPEIFRMYDLGELL